MNRAATSSQAPPRLGPIGQDIKFDSGSSSLVGDFSSLRFDDRGSFKLSFDTTDGNFGRRDVSAGSEREKNSSRVPDRRQSKSAAGETTTKLPDAPSVALPKFVESHDASKGFLDTWLLNDVQTGGAEKENRRESLLAIGERAKSNAIPQAKTPIASLFLKLETPIASQFAGRTPLGDQSTNPKVKSLDVTTHRYSIMPMSTGLNGHPVTTDLLVNGKRKTDDDEPSSPSKRASTARNSVLSPAVTSQVKPSPEPELGAFPRPPSIRKSLDVNHDNIARTTSTASKRLSLDPGFNAPSRNLSLASKRMSMGSGMSDIQDDSSYRSSIGSKRFSLGSNVAPAEAQQVQYQRPIIAPKIVDSDTASNASSSPTAASSVSSKKFEIKSVNLLTPVTLTSADKQAAVVSNTISRINSNSISAPTSAPRSNDVRRVVTDSSQHRQLRGDTDERSPSRRLSQPAIRNSYISSRSVSPAPANLSRTPTPDLADGPGPAPRPRRPSSRLSDRMSWLKELEDANAKQTGRDFVFRKLEGGVAAKLAAFEHKSSDVSGTSTPAIGVSRRNSVNRTGPAVAHNGITRQTSTADLYSIEGRTRRTSDTPGVIAVDAGFKKKLEGVTGHLAKKVERGEEVPESSKGVRGPAALAAARKKVPQEVLDLIMLAGVDPEVAINEYLQHGTYGKTGEWDHEEILRQIGDMAEDKKEKLDMAKKESKVETEKKEAKTEAAIETKKIEDAPVTKEIKANAPVSEKEQDANAEPTKDETPSKVVEVEKTKEVVPKIDSPVSIPVETASQETKAADPQAEKPKEVVETPETAAKPSQPDQTTSAESKEASKSNGIVTSSANKSSEPTVSQTQTEASQEEFNAASLPAFGH
ncbi:hypothetical protein BT63DRAFT_311488 [Microthyrium microscopicum]|uniref:Uncharacterized protein n=1 Tax=Microthyrium microscopicum TaxID=703497 RepID=A0A6A6U5Z5_9PEZI|nr:hypothetical protein BT63DRAFT_311488 [Microthyrium microscopicum]